MLVYYDALGAVTHVVKWIAEGYAPPPGDYIEVSAADLGDLFQWEVHDGELRRRVGLSEESRGRLLEEINVIRGAARARFITVLPGQDMVYQDKERQGLAYLADAEPLPDPALYPAIYAEVGVTAPSAYEVAQVYVNLAQVWRQISALIEGAALAAITAVELATTVAEAEAAMSALAAALEAVHGLA